jgi:hypothetical protein
MRPASRYRPGAALARTLLAALLAPLLAFACDGAPASPSPSTPGAASASPMPSLWPSGVPAAVLALAATDNEIRKASVDLVAAAEAEDPEAMLGAAQGLARLTDANIANADLLDSFEVTRPAGAKTREAMIGLRDAAFMIRDSIRAGDAAGVEEGSRRLAAAVGTYGEARVLLAALVEEALRQTRALPR